MRRWYDNVLDNVLDNEQVVPRKYLMSHPLPVLHMCLVSLSPVAHYMHRNIFCSFYILINSVMMV